MAPVRPELGVPLWPRSMVTAACSAGNGAATTTVAPASPDTVASNRRNVDGRIRLGVWLPSSGIGATLGTPLLAAVELAVREINGAGGINGELLDVAIADEGSDPATAYQALTELLESDQVDVIVGPASSRIALGALDVLAEARAVTCSPTSAAYDLGERRDDGYFVRTIGSEALEAMALTKAMIEEGTTRFSVLFPEDDYGFAFADQVQREFRRLRQEVRLVPYDPTQEQFNGPVELALADDVEAVGVVGSGAVGARVLRALALQDAPPERLPTFVTDGLRRDDLGELIEPRQPTASAGIRVVAPMARPMDPKFEAAFAVAAPGGRVAYAAYAYDCVNLLALAAQAAGSDDAEGIRAQLTAVSSGGSRCRGFADCARLLEQGRNIDLEGASGDLELQDDGDVGEATYEVFAFDEEGKEEPPELFTIRVDSD